MEKQRRAGDEDAAGGVEQLDTFGASLFKGEEKTHDHGSAVIAILTLGCEQISGSHRSMIQPAGGP